MTSEHSTASIDALTKKLSDMPEWSGNLLDPAKSALTEAGMKSVSLEDRAYALSQLNEMVHFHKKHLCSGRGAPLVSATAPSGPFAPDQIDASRRFRTSEAASKMTYNLVVLDGKKDYIADRQEINPDLRATGVVPDEAVTCQIVVPSKTRVRSELRGDHGHRHRAGGGSGADEAAHAILKVWSSTRKESRSYSRSRC